MIRTRVRKILRDVWARKGRTFLVSFAIFIGVTGTIALFSMSDILVGQLKEDIKEDELPMVEVNVTVDTGIQLDNVGYLKMLDDFPGVTEVMGGMEAMQVYFKQNEDDEDFEEAYMQSYVALSEDGTTLIDVPIQAEQSLQPYRLLEGSYPTLDANEVVIETRMADEYDIAVGDTLYTRVLSPSRDPELNGATGTVEPFTVTGIVFHPYSETPKQSMYTSMNTASYITGRSGFVNIWARFIDYETAQDQLDDFIDLIATDTPYTVDFYLPQDPAQNSLIMQAQQISNLMAFLALVALIVSGFLVINVIASLVVEQKRQIGVMKSLGASRRDNFFIYSGIAFCYGLIGVIPGVIIGIPAGNAAAHGLAPQMNTILDGFRTSPFSIIMGILVGLAVPVFASLIPVFNGTRVSILDAMTDLGIGAKYGTGPLARLIHRLPVPITVRQGLSNVSLKKGRLTFTVITLAIAAGAFMGIYAIFQTFTDGIRLYIDSFNAQIGYGPQDARDPDEFTNLLYETYSDEIKTIGPGFMSQVEFEGYEPEITAMGPPGIFAYGYEIEAEDPAFTFEIDEGKSLTPDNADTSLILSSALATAMDKKVGDTVVMKVPGASRELTVVGISENPLEQAWMSWVTLAEIASYTFDRITSDSPIQSMIPPEANQFVKYGTLVQIEGFDEGPTLALGLTPAMGEYLSFTAGEYFSPTQSGIVLSTALAEKSGFQVGDTLTLDSQSENGTSVEFPVLGIVEPPSLLGAQAAGMDQFVGMFWRDLTDLDGAQVESKPRPGFFFINTVNDKPSAKELDDLISEMNDTMAERGITAFSLNVVEMTDMIMDIFRTIQMILSAVAGLIALVGALGLLTTLSMSVFERQKEIGVMRSIGAGSATVAGQFLTEGIVVGIIAWIVGLPLMLLIQWLLLIVTQGQDLFPLEFSLEAALIGLVGMLVITTIASLWPSLGAARKTVSDILRYQ